MMQTQSSKKFDKTLFGHHVYYSVLYHKYLVPSFVSTRHLTLMTLFWSAFLFYFNNNWIAMSILIFLQRVTDTWDGAIGRERNEGYVKWGYFVDHFLDWVFLCCIMGALYVHTQDVWCLFICFPISIYVVGFFFVNYSERRALFALCENYRTLVDMFGRIAVWNYAFHLSSLSKYKLVTYWICGSHGMVFALHI